MIEIADKRDCCGCGGCAQRCPQGCISMESDTEGFPYPVVDADRCTDCGACERVCPVINRGERPAEVPATYAAYSRDEETRRLSSSGGVFTVLAEEVIAGGGVVFGARFDSHWGVMHDFTDTLAGLAQFRGSKYLQSLTGDSYARALGFLKEGRRVLFSGTPCQVAGLRRYLGREYPGLLTTVDFVCHGVPSPLVWRKYLESVLLRTQCAAAGKNTESMSLNGMPFMGISFRDKRLGWKKYGIRLQMSPFEEGDRNSESASTYPSCGELYEPFADNRYMRAFLSDLSLRPSCYSCPAKGFSSGADVTIGDFWGIDREDPAADDGDRGTSVVFVRNPRVLDTLRRADVFLKEEPYGAALRHNPSVERPVGEPPYRAYFFSRLRATGDFDRAHDAVFSRSLLGRIRRRLWLKLRKK